MLTSSSSSNQISSFPFMNQTLPENENPNPTSFLDDGIFLSHILHSDHHQFLSSFTPPIELQCFNATERAKKVPWRKKPETDTDHIDIGSSSSANQPAAISKKRNSKDRHSKICTSKGPRDRRMRLSLEIARSFFDLQDLLGFDKASKTVEWLFAKSKTAIIELKEKCFSECRDYSEEDLVKNVPSVSDEIPKGKIKRRRLRVVDKESRCRARARARERTREKMIHRFLGCQTDISPGVDGKILEMEGKSVASLIQNNCENEVVSGAICSDRVHFPDSSMDMSTISFESMRSSPAGLKLLELDEIDHVLIFYAE